MSAVHCCTVVSRNYLAHARVLAESFLAHHPTGRFSLLLVDRDAGELALAEQLAGEQSFELLLPADVGIDGSEFDRRATMYATQGMVASFKPDLMRTLLARERSPILLLDADGCVYADLSPVAELAARHALVVSPHSLDPYPLHGADAGAERWRRDSPDQIVMRAGVMNAGLIAIGPTAGEFLEWWSQRTRRRCVFDQEHGLMLCQPWLTLAIALFDCAVLRDRGCNVAGWNLLTRDVQWDGERPTIDGEPLRHFHFAGSFDPERPDALTPVSSLAEWWAPLAERPGAARLVREYAQRLLDHGYRQAHVMPAPNARAPGGQPIEPWMRETYRRELMASERDGAAEPPNPFGQGPERFAEWLRARADRSLDRSARPAGTGGEPDLQLDRPELRAALLEGSRLLERIGELEQARDEASEWGERASAELRRTESELAQARARTGEAEQALQRASATMEAVWSSLSWRVTAPLRATKARLRRR